MRIGYYLRLALKSLARTPGLTALMMCAIGFGIAACIVMLTIYHAMSGNPIWWKNNVLYAVTMDTWAPRAPFDSDRPALPPPQLTYRDASYLFQSAIPQHKVMMYPIKGVLSGAPGQRHPAPVLTRATTADFFAMFDVSFEYGGAWDAAADRGPDPVVVISHEENERLFGGADSVGHSILWNGHPFRIVGVMGGWWPKPRFYDVINGAFDKPEDVYVPFGWGPALQQLPVGMVACWGDTSHDTYAGFLGGECSWIQMWVELPNAASRDRMLALMNAYAVSQRKSGRFRRPLDNRLTRVSQWLAEQGVVTNDSRLLLRLAFAFLAVSLINTAGILLAKFLRAAPTAGVRRALGATRAQIFLQYLIEVAALSLAGSGLGLALGALGLRAMHWLYAINTVDNSGYQELTHFDPAGLAWALALAFLSTFAAGLYPAWRIGRLPPATYLKSQ